MEWVREEGGFDQGGEEAVNGKSQQGVHVSSAARCLFPSQSPKQQPSVPITAQEAPLMTIRHHLQMLQLPPVILLSFSVNYTNHFLQDGSLGCQPINLSFLYLCLLDP